MKWLLAGPFFFWLDKWIEPAKDLRQTIFKWCSDMSNSWNGPIQFLWSVILISSADNFCSVWLLSHFKIKLLFQVWDEELSVIAQRHADQCKFAHDCSTCRKTSRYVSYIPLLNSWCIKLSSCFTFFFLSDNPTHLLNS